MPLEMRKTSQWWYGRYNVGGKVMFVNLDIPIEGRRPASMRKDGDKAFERSRGHAQEKFDGIVRGANEKQDSSVYVKKLYEIRTGRQIDSIPLAKLAEEWDKASRKRAGSPRYVKQVHAIFKRFVEFMEKNYKEAVSLADVSPAMAESFMSSEKARRLSGRTFNGALILLRSAFKVLSHKGNVVRNPFSGIVTADEETTHRMPFNRTELEAILRKADDDPFIRPVIVTGIFTAMRRGDCCLLRWADVDLKERFVRVKTGKTGETVEIPLFPLLQGEIEERGVKGGEFVFPGPARMYQDNPQGITYRVRRVFEAAGFYDEKKEDEENGEVEEKNVRIDRRPLLPAEELQAAGLKALGKLPEGEMDAGKREHMTEAFKAYVGGTSLPDVAEKMGMSKSSVSLYLHEMDKLTGLRVLRPAGRIRPEKRLGDVSISQEGSRRRSSVRDFHSFRVTWITIALAAGVPMELVTRVTGHQTVNVVLKHYFRPGREDFRQAIEGAMPKLLSGPATDVPAEVVKYDMEATPGVLIHTAIDKLENVTGKNWKVNCEQALKALRGAARWVDSHLMHEKSNSYTAK